MNDRVKSDVRDLGGAGARMRVVLSTLLVLAGLALAPGAASGADRTIEFGESFEGRELRAHRIGPRDAERSVLVIGSIHGNEDRGARDREAPARRAPERLYDLARRVREP